MIEDMTFYFVRTEEEEAFKEAWQDLTIEYTKPRPTLQNQEGKDVRFLSPTWTEKAL